jgi:hypothetical protein
MSSYARSTFLWIFALSVTACGGAGETTLSTTETASIQLELTTLTPSGNTYRLGPATFDITGKATLSVEATGDEPLLHVAVDPGDYQVTLRAGWVLQMLKPFLGPTVFPATLVSPAVQPVRVEPGRSTPLTYAFHLGESGIDIGIEVEEGVPPGYDGLISPLEDGRFEISFAGGGGACCFDSVSEARDAYPSLFLFFSEP